MTVFVGKSWGTCICYKGSYSKEMSRFRENLILRFEFDREKGTLFLLVDSIQQELYISGIKVKVRFIV
ncbi:MAG: hypothetical protein EZS28_035096 [Streblomastix strix]|uniref:Uncharacterized protein n=1 Tax=Streblomastix strix TaxID=222440 RepID=A0A5J4UG75_9EUKA|nr:MAG: hypothetical protein EZS28_035096 [Streblomastix strix]